MFGSAFKQNTSAFIMCDSSYGKCIVAVRDPNGRAGNSIVKHECTSSSTKNKKFYESCAEQGTTEVIINEETDSFQIKYGGNTIRVKKGGVY